MSFRDALLQLLERQQCAILAEHPSIAFCLGVSGGQDSMALLHLFSRLKNLTEVPVIVVYVHHGLSPNADEWQSLVEAAALKWGFPFRALPVTIEGTSNLEEKARVARYDAFEGLFAEWPDSSTEYNPCLVLGHHEDDQVEQFFLGLARAAGPGGLSGNDAFARHYKGFFVWRPLLSVSRQDLSCYISTHSLPFAEDESNQDCRLSRNYIRHQVLPTIIARWPQFATQVRQSQQWFREADRCAQDLAMIDYRQFSRTLSPAKLPGLDLNSLLALPDYRAKNVLQFYLKSHGCAQLRGSLWSNLKSSLCQYQRSPKGQQIAVSIDFKQGLYIGCAYGVVFLYKNIRMLEGPGTRQQVERHCGVQFVDPVQKNIEQKAYPHLLVLPSSLNLDDGLSWRIAAPGDRVLLPGKGQTRSLKKLWQVLKVPLPLRVRWPVQVNKTGQIIFVPFLED